MKFFPSLASALVFFLLASFSLAEKSESWMEKYNQLLGKYVSTGGVRYAAWKSEAGDLQTLQKVVDAISNASVSDLGKKEQLAFYVNAYNAWILHEALKKYPTKSVKDPLYTFFLAKRIKVAGEEMSFNHLEKNVIRSKFNDPGVHFALNCASRSCPPLNAKVFRGEQIDAQLEKLAKAFVNSVKGVNYRPEKKAAELSMIFEWYRDDFKDGGPLEFINRRRATPLPEDTKISYQKYDWSLNEVQ